MLSRKRLPHPCRLRLSISAAAGRGSQQQPVTWLAKSSCHGSISASVRAVRYAGTWLLTTGTMSRVQGCAVAFGRLPQGVVEDMAAGVAGDVRQGPLPWPVRVRPPHKVLDLRRQPAFAQKYACLRVDERRAPTRAFSNSPTGVSAKRDSATAMHDPSRFDRIRLTRARARFRAMSSRLGRTCTSNRSPTPSAPCLGEVGLGPTVHRHAHEQDAVRPRQPTQGVEQKPVPLEAAEVRQHDDVEFRRRQVGHERRRVDPARRQQRDRLELVGDRPHPHAVGVVAQERVEPAGPELDGQEQGRLRRRRPRRAEDQVVASARAMRPC